jgi:hypothetical protein
MLRLRRTPVPDVVKDLPLEPGERRVAWALTPAGEPVVATERALHLTGRPPLPWDEIERASFAAPLLTVVELSEQEGTGPTRVVELDLSSGTDLPAVVRARVSASVAWTSRVRLQPRGAVRIVGRRRAGREVLDWQLVFDRDTDPHDPVLRAQAQQHLEAARRTIG